MYNGIGLTSVRGSGTNGYVQRNMAHVSREQTARRKSMDIPLDRDQVKAPKGANLEILEHNRKREIEVKVMKLRLSLEEKGHLKDDEVEAKCDAFRQELLSKLPARSGGPGGSSSMAAGGRAGETHADALAKAAQSAQLKSALGIKSDHVVGAAFDRELQERKKQERIEKREAEEAAKAAAEEELAREQEKEERRRAKEERRREKEERRAEKKKRRREEKEQDRSRSRSRSRS